MLDTLSASGLSRLPAERCRVGKDVADPAAILERSADLHGMSIPASVRAIGRAGAGNNNTGAQANRGRERRADPGRHVALTRLSRLTSRCMKR